MVVITAETELDAGRSQPSGPPIAAGHIPGLHEVQTPPPAVEVLMGEVGTNVFAFSPQTITVLSGQTVRWTNVSGKLVIPHTATRAESIDDCAPGQTPPCPASGRDFEFDSGPVPPNGSFTHTFTLPQGTPFALFTYHCTPHRLLGMTGRIFVEAPPQ
jgi:plastocyanin